MPSSKEILLPFNKTMTIAAASKPKFKFKINGCLGNKHESDALSPSLTATESRHSNTERGCLAVLLGLEKFEYCLLWRFKLTTHH